MEAAQTTRPLPRESTLVHFEIPANEPDKTAHFYEQLFSWKIAKVPMGPMDYWLISHKDAGENETMGGLYKKTMGETGFLNHFSVVNIDQSLAKGTEEIPNIGWFAILQDPDGNTFALFQASGRM